MEFSPWNQSVLPYTFDNNDQGSFNAESFLCPKTFALFTNYFPPQSEIGILAARAKEYAMEVDKNSTLDLDIIWPDEVKVYKNGLFANRAK